MSDYISREAAIKELLDTYEREFPTADGAFDLFAVRIMPRVRRIRAMTIDRAIEILDPERREHYDGMDEVNEACRMGMEALERTRWIPCSERLPESDAVWQKYIVPGLHQLSATAGAYPRAERPDKCPGAGKACGVQSRRSVLHVWTAAGQSAVAAMRILPGTAPAGCQEVTSESGHLKNVR